MIAHGGDEQRRWPLVKGKLDAAAPCVLECIARDLGHGGRQPCLFLSIEPESRRELTRALSYQDDIMLAGELESEDGRRRGHR